MSGERVRSEIRCLCRSYECLLLDVLCGIKSLQAIGGRRLIWTPPTRVTVLNNSK